MEPELISPEEQDELLDETDKESGEEEENKKIFQELNHTVVQNSYIFLQSSQEKIWRRLYI